jgi:hypothetical protein
MVVARNNDGAAAAQPVRIGSAALFHPRRRKVDDNDSRCRQTRFGRLGPCFWRRLSTLMWKRQVQSSSIAHVKSQSAPSGITLLIILAKRSQFALSSPPPFFGTQNTRRGFRVIHSLCLSRTSIDSQDGRTGSAAGG